MTNAAKTPIERSIYDMLCDHPVEEQINILKMTADLLRNSKQEKLQELQTVRRETEECILNIENDCANLTDFLADGPVRPGNKSYQ